MDVRLKSEADAESLKGYDEIILATGARARNLDLPGISDPAVMEAIDYLLGRKESGEHAVIIGGGLTADNVREGISRFSPDMVDVMTGVEDSPGIKSREKLTGLVRSLEEKNMESAASSGL